MNLFVQIVFLCTYLVSCLQSAPLYEAIITFSRAHDGEKTTFQGLVSFPEQKSMFFYHCTESDNLYLLSEIRREILKLHQMKYFSMEYKYMSQDIQYPDFENRSWTTLRIPINVKQLRGVALDIEFIKETNDSVDSIVEQLESLISDNQFDDDIKQYLKDNYTDDQLRSQCGFIHEEL